MRSRVELGDVLALRPIGSMAWGVVQGRSMWPLLRVGDEVYVERCEAADLIRGELAVFRSAEGSWIVHVVTGARPLATATLRGRPDEDPGRVLGRVRRIRRRGRESSVDPKSVLRIEKVMRGVDPALRLFRTARLEERRVALRVLSRAVQGLSSVAQALEEVPRRWAGDRELVWRGNADHYGRNGRYEKTDDESLLPFEVRALERFFPAPPARLLLHGAGGGRELSALLRRGYRVDAYEPHPRLAARCETVHRKPCAAESIEQWSRRPRGRYEGVVVGWGAWSHVLRRADRIRALRAFRSVSDGPVLLSFWSAIPLFDVTEAAEVVRPSRAARLARSVLDRVWGSAQVESAVIWRRGFFAHEVTRTSLYAEATEVGYRVVHYEEDPRRYPNAVLMPAE